MSPTTPATCKIFLPDCDLPDGRFPAHTGHLHCCINASQVIGALTRLANNVDKHSPGWAHQYSLKLII
ncbi:hypothetical protein TH8_20215 [Thalassospira profundimaris]|nr:hypothetical protein TH8_20215 [Thalassospira profundimaris]